VFEHRSPLTLVALGVLTVAGGREVRAQTTADTVRIEQAIAEALRESPQVRAARLKAEIQQERDVRAGSLADPVLNLGLMNRPFDFGADQAVTMNQIQLSQQLPWAGKRSSSRAREDGLARAAELDAVEVAASVIARVRTLYYRIAYLDRAIGVMRETQSLLADLQQTVSTLYSVGSAVQQDVLRAHVAEARMEADIRVMGEQRIASGARLNALLGRAPGDAIGWLELPDPTLGVPPLDTLMRLAENRPAVRAARARVEAATAQREFADRAHLPDFAVTVGYSQRPRFDDLFSVMVGIPIPVRRSSSQEPLRRESEAAEVAAEASELELYNETYASLAERRSEAIRAADVSELLRTDVLPQARAAVESGLSAYRVGRLDFMAVLESQMLVNQFEIERVRLAAEHQSALAAIDALIGVIPGGVQ
jgi:cobalt-zinc-cadmium efflux system outer membrane protein